MGKTENNCDEGTRTHALRATKYAAISLLWISEFKEHPLCFKPQLSDLTKLINEMKAQNLFPFINKQTEFTSPYLGHFWL